jgi:hypothetical protein
MKPLTRAQKRMLIDALEKGGRTDLYGAWDFRCARNLMNLNLGRLSGPTLLLTEAGYLQAAAYRVLKEPDNPPDVWRPIPVCQASWLTTKWTCTTKENIHEAYPEDHKQTCGVWHYKEEAARQHAAKLNRKSRGRVHTKDG